MRERHFYTALVSFFFILLSHIHIINIKDTRVDTLSFMVPGSLMHVGMRPFALMNIPVTLGKINDYEGRVISLALTMLMACQDMDSWRPVLYLLGVAYVIAHGMSFLDVYGSISLCTVLTCLDAAQHVVKNLFTWQTIVFTCMLSLLTWLDQIHVTIPLTHVRRRTQNISMKIPLMFNSLTALVLYATVAEYISHPIIIGLFMYPIVQYINNLLPKAQKKTGSHLIAAWAGERYFIPGWRSKEHMASYVQRIIDRNIWRSTICACGLWAMGKFLYIEPVKYLLLMSTVKRYVTQRG